MPSRYSSEGTRGDAQRLAENLGTDFREIAIEPIVEQFIGALAPSFADVAPDLTEENLQARARGVLLMALSNKFGWLLVATGNKSEMSVGYATLYGDMAGGFALLKDVYKTDVFRLARHLNERAGRELIPQSIIDRAPSAELRADQLDEDSLPPYPQLDRVLEAYVEDDRTLEELSRTASTRTSSSAPSRSSTAPSTSAARRRPACGCGRRPSAATGARRSRTAGEADATATGSTGRSLERSARSSGLVGTPSSSSSVNQRSSCEPSSLRSSCGAFSNAGTRTR